MREAKLQPDHEFAQRMRLSPYDQFDWEVEVRPQSGGKGWYLAPLKQGADLISMTMSPGHYPRTRLGFAVAKFLTERTVNRLNNKEQSVREMARQHYQGTSGTYADLRRQVIALISHL